MVAIPAPQPPLRIDASLLVLCPTLPEPASGSQSEQLYLNKTLITLYAECARKDDALVQAVEILIERSGNEATSQHSEKIDTGTKQ